MNQRLALVIAAAITAFVLVVVGALSVYLSGATSQTVNAPSTSAATATPAPAAAALDPTVEALLREREAAYQAALAEANARLEAANAQIASANQQLASATQAQASSNVSGSTVSVVAPATGAAISEQQAIALAQRYYGGQVVAVERETEHGALVYDVKFSDRSSVYVDAATGQVVYARIASGGDGDDRFERERHDEHDD